MIPHSECAVCQGDKTKVNSACDVSTKEQGRIMMKTTATRIPILIAVIVFLLPSETQARARIPLLITYGEKMTPIADVPNDAPVKVEYPDAAVGYRYDHVGIFWMELWTWNGEFCVYSDDKSTAIIGMPEEISLATGIPESKITKPFFYSCPPLLGTIVLLGVLAGLVKIMEIRSEAKEVETRVARTGCWAASSVVAGASTRSVYDADTEHEWAKDRPSGGAQGQQGTVATIDEDAPPTATKAHEALLNAICCVLCADGKIRSREREAAHRILERARVPWSDMEIDFLIDEFLERVKQEGLRSIVQETCEQLQRCSDTSAKKKAFFQSLDYMARADGSVDEKEERVCRKFRAALGA